MYAKVRYKLPSRYEIKKGAMKARQFCDRWLRPTEEEINERGYRQKCVNLLSEILGVTPNAVHRWGSGLEFEGMPAPYEKTLAYADLIRQLLESTASQTDLMDILADQLRDRT